MLILHRPVIEYLVKLWGARLKQPISALRILCIRLVTFVLGLRSRDVMAEFTPTEIWGYLLGKTFSLYVCSLDWGSSRANRYVQNHWLKRSTLLGGVVTWLVDPYRQTDQIPIINHPEYLDILTSISYIPHLELPIVYTIRGEQGHTGGLYSGRDLCPPLVNVYEVFKRRICTLQLQSDEIAVGLSLSDNYWHMLIDNLSRLVATSNALALHYPQLKPIVVVCSLPNSVQQSALDILELKIVCVPPKQITHIQQFALYSRTWISPQNVLRMKRVFQPAAAKIRVAKRPYIYISRSTRGLSNQDLLEAWLAKRGFETVRLENLSFIEQIALFSTAKVIVGCHGAGMANIIWAPQGARVIELASKTYWNSHVQALAFIIGAGYTFLNIDTENAEFGCGLKAILSLQDVLDK